MKELKSKKGITLVALVVTIIILIILAGISISILTGEDGLIAKAKQAKENMELAEQEEQGQLNTLYDRLATGTGPATTYDSIAEYQQQIIELQTKVNNGTVTADKMLKDYTAYKNGAYVTGTIESKTAQTYTPGTTNQTITAGQYLSGDQTILGDDDLVAGNIKSGVEIFGVTGTNKGTREATDNIINNFVSSQTTNQYVYFTDEYRNLITISYAGSLDYYTVSDSSKVSSAHINIKWSGSDNGAVNIFKGEPGEYVYIHTNSNYYSYVLF